MSVPRRFFVPEVVQTSAMDCGPASLKSLLGGVGIHVHYDRLREACQTDIDGTSIDTLEVVGRQLGLEAEQIMVPPDHLFLPAARALPAIAVVTVAQGMAHFVVVWRVHGGWVQVMDPAAGRRWLRRDQLRGDLYIHEHAVPASAWREWANSDEFRTVIAARSEALGIRSREAGQLAELAGEDPGWEGLAVLDAALRLGATLVRSRGLRRGTEVAALVRSSIEAHRLGEDNVIPDRFWSVVPARGGTQREPLLMLRGAVLLRTLGRRDSVAGLEAPADAEEQPLSPETTAALREPDRKPLRELFGLMRRDGLLGPSALALSTLIAAAAVVGEALALRAVLGIGHRLVLPEHRIAAAAVLLVMLLAMTSLELPIAHQVLRLGRRLETRLRLAVLEKAPRLADAYFRSRLASDMAERSHSVHKLRDLPQLTASALRSGVQAALTAAALAWLDPSLALLATAALGAVLILPIVVQPPLAERDLRLRNHTGALSRSYLDALLGLVPARNHGAEKSLLGEHEALLLEWERALLRRQRAKVVIDAIQASLGYGFAIALVLAHVRGPAEGSQVLLIAYWALQMKILGQQMAIVAEQLPLYRNVTLRLLEPLRGTEAPRPGSQDRRRETGGVALALEEVRVVASGFTILESIDVSIRPGEHAAIVGRSGAGKSTLLGLFLGWHEAAAGRVLVNGAPLDAERLERLRRETAWVDPAVQLWNRTLFENLLYGATNGAPEQVGDVLERAALRPLIQSLPDGLATRLGEGGASVSGGEGQRVRLGRAMLRADARLVLLDEPFRGLDRGLRRELTQRARERWQDATLLFVSHDLGETLGFDRVLVVEDGAVVESGPPSVLAAQTDSRFAKLLAAERAVQNRFTDGAMWRRLRLDPNGLTEPRHEESPS